MISMLIETRKLVKKYRWFLKALWLTVILMNLSGCSENSNYDTNISSQKNDFDTKKTIEVHIGVPSKNLPPYFIYWDRTGIEQDILREAFQKSNYHPNFSYIRNREKKFLKPAYGLDCISTVTKKLGYDGFYSDDVIIYQDVAIYLKNSGLDLKTKADLANLTNNRIEAFKDANKYLDIKDIVANNPFYHEHSGKASQIVLLYRGKVEVLLMDKHFFWYFRNKVKKLIDIEKEIVIRHLFPKRAYKILCKTEKIRDDFNNGLAALHLTGGYAQIIKRYVRKHY